jgi:hypothetical protein
MHTKTQFQIGLKSGMFFPEIVVIENFVHSRSVILSLCRERGINTVHTEGTGFFPHYTTLYADPLGFCWESLLTRSIFANRCTSAQRARAYVARREWLNFKKETLPANVRKPFVLWPLQLIRDRVNKFDLNMKTWTPLLKHFRSCLPSDFQLVIKNHPRSRKSDLSGVHELVREMPNTIFVSKKVHLKSLLDNCSGLGGANSTVLYEGRLMFSKPVYVYAKGWFTNHEKLFFPISHLQQPCLLPYIESIGDNNKIRTSNMDEYVDWFLAQLLARQITYVDAVTDKGIKDKLYKLSYKAFVAYGEEIFNG